MIKKCEVITENFQGENVRFQFFYKNEIPKKNLIKQKLAESLLENLK